MERVISLDGFQNKLCSLRYDDYYALMTEIWGALGLPEDRYSPTSMEVMIIKATKDSFNNTIDTDITLMALGLLEGFCHHTNNGKAESEFPTGDRRIKFLKESSYLIKECSDIFGQYGDIENYDKTIKKRVIDRLTKREDKDIAKVAQIIYNKSDIIKYLDLSRQEYLLGGKTLIKVKYPPLLHTRKGCSTEAENNQSAHSTRADGTKATEKDESSGAKKETKEMISIQDISVDNRAIALAQVSNNNNIVVQVNLADIDIHPNAATKNRPPVTRILVFEGKVSLQPEESCEIALAVQPRAAQGSPLSYVSLDASIVTVSKDGIITAQEKEGATQVIIQAESGVTAKIEVTVRDEKQATRYPPSDVNEGEPARNTTDVAGEKKKSEKPAALPNLTPEIHPDVNTASALSQKSNNNTRQDPNNSTAMKATEANPIPAEKQPKVKPREKGYGWGPERPLYTMNNPARKATFNSITDNAAVGDERAFVRIEEKDSGRTYSSSILVEPGKKYEVYIYYHNDASETFNDQAHGFVGVARETRLASMFPTKLKKGECGRVFGRITSPTAEPKAVWGEAYMTAKEAVTLHYVAGTARIYNGWGANGRVLPISLFTDKGTFIGLNELNGLILGGDRYAGQVVYTIEAKEVETPEGIS